MAKEGENLSTEEGRVGSERDGGFPLCAIQDTPETQVSKMRALLCHQPPFQEEAALTFVAVAHRVKVDVVLVAAEEEEAEPGVEGIDGHNEKDANYVALLLGDGVIPQVRVDLQSAQHAELWLPLLRRRTRGAPSPEGCRRLVPC